MEPVHVHLLLNHFPIIGTLIGTILLIAGLATKNNKGMIHSSFVIIAVCAAITIPVVFSGEGAEETVEHIEGISHDVIHEHEEAGEMASWFMYATGAFALLSLFLSKRKHALARMIAIITLLLSLTAFFFMARTGLSGGGIRHTEIRE